jgi:hypothetical protein
MPDLRRFSVRRSSLYSKGNTCRNDVGSNGPELYPLQRRCYRKSGDRGDHRNAVEFVRCIHHRPYYILGIAAGGLFDQGCSEPENAERPSFQSVKRAWKYAFSRQELIGTYFIDIAAMFFAMPQALYPALAVIYGEKYVGFFPAAIAAGALIASLTSGWTKNIHRHGLMVTIAAVLWEWRSCSSALWTA